MFGEGDMNEAYVPLPDGRRIPVQMSGRGGGHTFIIDARGADRSGLAACRRMIARSTARSSTARCRHAARRREARAQRRRSSGSGERAPDGFVGSLQSAGSTQYSSRAG
jgi:hypothetical protein